MVLCVLTIPLHFELVLIFKKQFIAYAVSVMVPVGNRIYSYVLNKESWKQDLWRYEKGLEYTLSDGCWGTQKVAAAGSWSFYLWRWEGQNGERVLPESITPVFMKMGYTGAAIDKDVVEREWPRSKKNREEIPSLSLLSLSCSLPVPSIGLKQLAGSW